MKREGTRSPGRANPKVTHDPSGQGAGARMGDWGRESRKERSGDKAGEVIRAGSPVSFRPPQERCYSKREKLLEN